MAVALLFNSLAATSPGEVRIEDDQEMGRSPDTVVKSGPGKMLPIHR